METIDRIEIEEPRVTDAPECWPHKEKYWSCFGQDKNPPRVWRWPWQKRPETEKGWSGLYYSKEDAEADANGERNLWEWDGLPAREISLKDAMFLTRRKGRKGILVVSWKNGKWVTVKKYKAEEPLPEDMR